jgi:ribosome-associated toxin RatA of RatAB toxin-antitoxin module
MPQAEESIVIQVPARVIYEIVYDFEKYPEFLSDVREVSVDGRKGNSLTAAFEIQVIKKIHYSLQVKGTPYKKISWNLLSGDLFKKNNGEWTFQEEGKGKTQATYKVDIDFSLFVPSLITSKLIGANLPGMLKRFKERAERLGNA